MPETPINKTRNKLARIYGIGIVIFILIFGFITLLASFLARLKLT